MSKRRTAVRLNTFVLIWGYDDGMLHYGVYKDGRYVMRSVSVSPLDQMLLPLLRRITGRSTEFGGIGISAQNIHGFSSSRLLLSTLNTLAWTSNIPIQDISGIRDRDRDAAQKAISKLSRHKRFQGPLVPQYDSPPDITATKRPKPFTVQ